LMPSVAQERSFLSLVKVRPLTTLELCGVVSGCHCLTKGPHAYWAAVRHV